MLVAFDASGGHFILSPHPVPKGDPLGFLTKVLEDAAQPFVGCDLRYTSVWILSAGYVEWFYDAHFGGVVNHTGLLY